MPSTWRLSVGVDQPLTSWARVRTTYARRTGRDLFRSLDIERPDRRRPSRSVRRQHHPGRVDRHARSISRSKRRLSLTYQPARLSGSVAYTLGEVMDDSDGALSLPPDSSDLSGEWGPSRQDIRHRLQGSINSNLWAGFRFDANLRAQSAAPYTITTGLDANRDGEHNERPAGLGRNSARGASSTNLDMTLTWGRPLRRATGGRRLPLAGPGGSRRAAAVAAAVDRIRGRASGADAAEPRIRRASRSSRARPTS